MRRLHFRLLLAALPLIAGCFPVVYSEKPLGEQVAVLEPEKWDGTWLSERGDLQAFRVADPKNGILAMWDMNGQAPCDQPPPGDARRVENLRLRQSGDWFFVEDSSDELYRTPAALFRTGTAWFAYPVDEERFQALVQQGTLPGRVDDGKVILGDLGPEHYRIILAQERPLFGWKPEVFMKLPDNIDPCNRAPQVK